MNTKVYQKSLWLGCRTPKKFKDSEVIKIGGGLIIWHSIWSKSVWVWWFDVIFEWKDLTLCPTQSQSAQACFHTIQIWLPWAHTGSHSLTTSAEACLKWGYNAQAYLQQQSLPRRLRMHILPLSGQGKDMLGQLGSGTINNGENIPL